MRRRSRHVISDDEIDRLLARHPPSPPPTKDLKPGPPWLPTGTRHDLGLSLKDWRWLTKMNAADKEPATGIVDDMVAWGKAYKARTKRVKERVEAIFYYRRVTELQALLADEGVAGPQLRAAQYYANKSASRFKTGGGLITFVWRTLNLPR